nr:hypothetical protein BaRGS_031157 [Batillaria attramentaria]
MCPQSGLHFRLSGACRIFSSLAPLAAVTIISDLPAAHNKRRQLYEQREGIPFFVAVSFPPLHVRLG